MLTKSQAIDAVRKTLPDDSDVVEEAVIEREYGWVIFCQTKRYLQTRDVSDIVVGSGGTLVEKNTGRLIHFGSAFSTEVNLKIYESGYLASSWWGTRVCATRPTSRSERPTAQS